MAINQDKLHEFLGKAIVDFGATFNAALIRIGDKLGLYKALAAGGTQTPAELATRTDTAERYVREWLSAQAAGGYVTYDSVTGKFHLSEEQAFAMADESSPVFLPGAFQVALAAAKAEEQLTERFKTGKGLGWHEPPGALRRHRTLFPPWLRRQSDQRLDSLPRRCRTKAQERHARCRCRLWSRRLHCLDGQVLSKV